MHVAVDGVGNHIGGGWSVLSRTVTELAADPRVQRLTVFCSPLDLLAERPVPANVEWIERGREHRSPVARLAWFSVGLDSEVERVGADVVLTMNGAGHTAAPRVCVVQQAFSVTGDLRRVKPRGFAAKLAVIRRQTRRAAASADAVVVQTSWMLSELTRNLGMPGHVLPIGLPRAQTSAGRARHGALVVGPDTPYKRRDLAVEAVAEVREGRELELTVVDGVGRARVTTLLQGAVVLVAASAIESFGLPVVEAFSAGCPVVAADEPWARAVADNAALFFDPADPCSAARQIRTLLHEPELAEDLAERGRERLRALWRMRPYEGLADLLEAAA